MGYDVGEDMDLGALEDVGAPPRRMRRWGGRRSTRAVVRNAPPNVNALPGVPPVALKEVPLGLGSVTFSASSGTALVLSVQPQIPFKGRRLVLDIARTGTSATGLVTVTAFNIGVKNQLAGTGSLIANAFAATAFGVELVLDSAGPGINITVNLAISAAPTTTDTVVVGGVLIGDGIS